MTEVACFCGCSYTFRGLAGACPRCGEVAAIMTESTVRDAAGAAAPGTTQVSAADLESLTELAGLFLPYAAARGYRG